MNYKGDLIVSRYREDISWLSEFSDYRIFLYNKGEPIEDSIIFLTFVDKVTRI